MARKHALKLMELRRIRARFVVILLGMAAVTALLIAYLAIRVFVLTGEKIVYLDFASLCFYGFAGLAMTFAQIAFLRHLTLGAGPRIEELTYTDDLTGLGNRRHIAKFLAEEFREAQLSKNPLSLVVLDLDDFKEINDSYGHKAGDLILRAASHALKETLREADFVGRTGGDEFMLVLPDTDSQCSSVVAHRIAERLSNITMKIDLRDAPGFHTIRGVRASVGISSYPANANTRRSLIEDADRTMYVAKNSGKGNVVISIARPAGREPKAPAAGITTFMTEIGEIMDRPGRSTAAQERENG